MSRDATILSAAAVAGALAMSSDAVAAAAPAVNVGSSGTGSAEDTLGPCSGPARASRCVEGVAPGAGPTGPEPVGSMPSEEFVRGGWFGRWDVADGADTTVLNVTGTTPDVGEIDIPRSPMQRNVDREWSMGCLGTGRRRGEQRRLQRQSMGFTLTGDQIIGVDPLHLPGTRVAFTRR